MFKCSVVGACAVATTCWVLAACGSSSRAPDPIAGVVHQYAVDLDANYKDSITQAMALQKAVNAFVQSPSAAGLAACQAAWLDAHQRYGQSEYSRFYGGPIDQVQGGVNEWPIDESFIDYTVQTPDGGIVNDPPAYPQITQQVLATADEKGSLENLSTGFHAIEFLLWGERPNPSGGPGTRPYTDYVDGGTAANQDRRRTYLQVATALLVADLLGLEAEWHLSDSASYASKLLAGPSHDALADALRGLSQMAISEILYERLDDPFVAKDEKDEESCFSETTIDDLVSNALGIEDAYLGHYTTLSGTVLSGPSISDLVKAKNPALDTQLRQAMAAARAAIGAIPPPFDQACLAPASSPANMAVAAAVAAFQPMQGLFDQVGKALGIDLNL
ncbi:MAG TPA: imelysin family protein [Polyangiaceae bacterium]|nr:imelysin family protein [Polyangiaceae bacterium]